MPTSTTPAWPTATLAKLPTRVGTIELARRCRAAVFGAGTDTKPILDLEPLWRAARIQTTAVPLSAARGMQSGLLVPLPRDRFAIRVDPAPRGGWGTLPEQLRRETMRHRMRFRACHELAHTFTYRRAAGTTPHRHILDSPEQELFCDAFARELLLPAAAAQLETERSGAAAPFHLSRDYDVSVEVAARAIADSEIRREVHLWFGDELTPQWASRSDVSPQARKVLRIATTVCGRHRRPNACWEPARRQLVYVS